MKNVFIDNSQYQFIKESIENEKKSVPSWLISKIDELHTPLSSDKKYINDALKRILEKSYSEAIDSFSDDITKFEIDKVQDKLNKLILICQKKEDSIKDALEKICSDAVSAMFNPEYENVKIECNLVRNIPNTARFHIKPDQGVVEYDSIEDIKNQDVSSVRRKYTNTITMGCALELSDKLLLSVLKEIFELDEELPHLYTKIVKINDYLLFQRECKITDKANFQDAYNDVTVYKEGDKIEIKAEGVIFPFLLTETIRGFIEAMTFKTLPDDKCEAIIDKCDVLEDEQLYMLFGRELWRMITNNEIDESTAEEFLKVILEPSDNDFNEFVDEVIVGTKRGKESVESIVKKVKRNCDYKSFENDLAKKREEKGIIVDGYFTEEELNENEMEEATYPETFNLEEFKSIRSFADRVRYCKSRLKYLGKGSSRIVFQIDDATVLKLAWNNKGIAQNEAEARIKNDYYLAQSDLFAEVYDVDDNYLWIEMQMARRAKKSDFKRITGYDFNVLYYWVLYCWNNSVAYRNQQRSIPEEYEMLFNSDKWDESYEYSIFDSLCDYIGNYQVQGIGDLQRITSWGVISEQDGDRLVLIDNGLSNDVLDNYYR